MSSTVTSWSPDTNTKASETTSTALNNATLSGTLTVTGATQLNGGINAALTLSNTLTVGVDDTGYDVKFFGATSGRYLLWDESADALKFTDSTGASFGTDDDMAINHSGSHGYIINTTGGLYIATTESGVPISIGHTTSEVTINDNLTVTGTLTLGSGAELTEAELEMLDGITAGTVAASKAVVVDSNKDAASFRNITLTGELDAGSLDISGNADIDGTTNLDAVDIDGAVQLDGTLTVGVDDTGYDVKFFGATSGAYMLWDESSDDLMLTGGAHLVITGIEGGTAMITLKADESDDDGDDWIFIAQATGNGLTIANNISGSIVSHVQVVPDATVTNSYLSVGGNIRVGGNVIQASDGGSTITLDTDDNVTIKGDLTVTGGVASLKETSTPSAVNAHGKIYCKSDNKLYFQDGAGTEHEISYA